MRPNWEEIQTEWENSQLSLAGLARKYSIKISTMKSRKQRGKWWRPEREKVVAIEKVELFPSAVREFIEKSARGKSSDEIKELVNRKFCTNYSADQISSFKVRNKIRSFEKVPIGSERVARSGEILIKVSDNGATYYDNWKRKRRYIWELNHGEIPDTHVVMFLDQDKSNCKLENLILVSKRQLAIINKYELLQRDAKLNESVLRIADLLLAMAERRRK